MNILKELFTTYWSQTTLLLLSVGYFIKRIFDLISKKKEINYNLFQEKRLNAVNVFFQTYSEVEQMWTALSIFDILNNKLSAKDIDEIIFPSLNKLKRSVLELQIYFEDKEHFLFNNILDNSFNINEKLSQIFFDMNSDKTITQKSNDFYFYKINKLKENTVIFKKISIFLRDTFR